MQKVKEKKKKKKARKSIDNITGKKRECNIFIKRESRNNLLC